MAIITKRPKEIKKTITVPVKKETADQLKALKNRINNMEGIDSNMDNEIDKAVVKMINKANKELDELDAQTA